jgi:hypothetical protein
MAAYGSPVTTRENTQRFFFVKPIDRYDTVLHKLEGNRIPLYLNIINSGNYYL